MTTTPSIAPRQQPTRTVVAALATNRGLILACQRRHDAAFPLKWEFPGGKLEPNETPKQALARELREELNIAVSIGPEIYRTRHRYPELPFELEIIFFSISLDSTTAKKIATATLESFEQIAWLPPSRLPSLDFLPADLELIRLLASNQIQFPE
jgi:8-oxo-dGTP diphosphatase